MPQTTHPEILSRNRRSEAPARMPRGPLDLSGFRAWAHSDDFPENGQVSFLAGEVFVDMSPEEIVTHNQVKRAVYKGWERFLDKSDVGDLLPDGPLLVNLEADLATEPDGILCLWVTLRSGSVAYREVVEGSERFVEVAGTPDVVLEVVSKSSVRKDTVILRELYHRAGIPEYWLIDARHADIEFQILVRGDADYVPAAADSKGFLFSPVLQKKFRLTRSTNPVGGWRYALKTR